jgi:hypothetical protein
LFHIPLFVVWGGGAKDQQILIGLFKFENNLSHFKSDFGFGNNFFNRFVLEIWGKKTKTIGEYQQYRRML